MLSTPAAIGYGKRDCEPPRISNAKRPISAPGGMRIKAVVPGVNRVTGRFDTAPAFVVPRGRPQRLNPRGASDVRIRGRAPNSRSKYPLPTGQDDATLSRHR